MSALFRFVESDQELVLYRKVLGALHERYPAWTLMHSGYHDLSQAQAHTTRDPSTRRGYSGNGSIVAECTKKGRCTLSSSVIKLRTIFSTKRQRLFTTVIRGLITILTFDRHSKYHAGRTLSRTDSVERLADASSRC